jgi:hypothetical protein
MVVILRANGLRKSLANGRKISMVRPEFGPARLRRR